MCLPFRKKDRFAGTDRLDLVLAVEFDLTQIYEVRNGEVKLFWCLCDHCQFGNSGGQIAPINLEMHSLRAHTRAGL